MAALSADADYDAALRRRAPHLGIDAETAAHRPFLSALFIACSPMGDMMPPQLMDMQFAAQDASFRHDHPAAMRRIASWNGQPVGRIIVDWDAPGHVIGVDIAVHPAGRPSGAGLAMLRAWLEVADGLGRGCLLNVIAANPAQRIYRHLGFHPVGVADADAAYVMMARAAV